MKIINLNFDKTLTSLAGNEFGRQQFEKQISNLDYDFSYKIIFPENIKHIATSFIQGFFQKFVECFGISALNQKVEIVSSIPNLKKFVIDSLL